MDLEKLNTFFGALEAVKRSYTCGVCSKLCKNPVTLSKCFHIICSEHYDNTLLNCPICGVCLEESTTFTDPRMSAAIDAAAQLDKMFEKFKANNVSSDVKSAPTGQSLQESTSTPVKSTKTQNVSTLSSKLTKSAEKRNTKGETPLHIACRLGKVDKIKELLAQGVNTNTKDHAGWTPLHEVVQNGRLDLVQLLLQYNTLIDVPGPNNETPLHEAIRYKHTEIAIELVQHGADINACNCKGETPLQLATEDLRKKLLEASENIIQTQSVNVHHISKSFLEVEMEDLRVYCISKIRTISNKLKLLCKHHNNLNIETKWSKKVTHLVADTDNGICTTSVDVLQGIVNGVWILSSDWVTKSTEKSLEPFEDYEVVGIGTKTNTGPRTARYNKYKQLPGIFNGCHFYLHNFNTPHEISKDLVLTKSILSKLITDAGGIVLRRVPNPELIDETEKLVPYHAKKDGKLKKCSHYIIYRDMYEPMYNMEHLKALPVGWLIECIEKYELCEPW